MGEIDPVYEELARRLIMGGIPKMKYPSKYLPRILEKLATVEQAKIVRELPATSGQLAEKLNIDESRVEEHIQEMIGKGLVVVTRKGPRMVRNVGQLHDTQNNPKYDEMLGEEYFDIWHAMEREEMHDGLLEMFAGTGIPSTRIIPNWRSIKDIPGVLPYEDMRAILRDQERIAVIPCTCKRIKRDRDCGTPDLTCIVVGSSAAYNINRGVGRELTYEEALELLDELEKYPLVHTTINQQAINVLICNCHWCCCEVFETLFAQNKYLVEEGVAKSRFEASIDPEKCQVCGTCVQRCQFGAAQMKYYPELRLERAYIDADKCMGCGSCVITCPAEARTMKAVRPPSYIPEIAAAPY